MNILLITNEQNIIETFGEKLILLRETDELSYCDYNEAPDIVFADKPDIVIIHEHNDKSKTINLIKYIKTQIDSVILLINKYDRDFILNAYDEGIDDYFSATADPSEISIRTVNCIKKESLKKKIKQYQNYLKQYEIFDKQTGVIADKSAKILNDRELSLYNYTDGALMVISPDEEGKVKYSAEKLIQAIKKSVRFSDVITHGGAAKIFIMISEGSIPAAVKILEKIKTELNGAISIKAGICPITSDKFMTLEKNALCALSESMLGNQEFAIFTENSVLNDESWLEEPKEKNYKLFRAAFNKKLEKVIAPVFYRLQKSWEEKLFNTKVEQYTGETQSLFRLTNPKQTSLLKIVYPGFAKVIVYITHEGLDSPENAEISLPLNQISTKEITKIVEHFIKEFKSTIE